MRKFLVSIIFIGTFITFTGCGDEPEAPIPTISQVDPEIENNVTLEENNNSEDSANTNNLSGNISSENLKIGESNISSIGEKIDQYGKSSDNGEHPVLIGEDVDYINTQFDSIYFDFDRYSIKESMLLTVNKNLSLMNSPQVLGYKVVIQGNCDEWGTDEYNYALGLRRAQVIRETLIAEGINEDRVRIVSYGESNPICLEQADDCWAKNRRVDFRLEK
jgi:peptidoglycan-associated lipoprotein